MAGKLSKLRSSGFLLYWLPPLLWMTAILVSSGDWGATRNTEGLLQWLLSWLPFHIPAPVEVIHYFLRIMAHMLAYGVQYFLWFRALQVHLGGGLKKSLLWALGLCFILALMDEGHQSLVASRQGRVQDVALDLVGIILAAILLAAFSRRRGRPPSP
jgi:VanZ family protein